MSINKIRREKENVSEQISLPWKIIQSDGSEETFSLEKGILIEGKPKVREVRTDQVNFRILAL